LIRTFVATADFYAASINLTHAIAHWWRLIYKSIGVKWKLCMDARTEGQVKFEPCASSEKRESEIFAGI
jgi:hypothetical protein